jgi:methyltransferase (TIGR00027 family)
MDTSVKRIEVGTSRTAEITCLARAASRYEGDPAYRSDDFIAPRLMPRRLAPILRIGPLRRAFIGALYPAGMYEYIIARTKYVDSVFRRSALNGVDQILIFGAGFDSRATRFAAKLGRTRVFELDAPPTQEAKLRQMRKRKVAINPSARFVAIDFSKESLEDRLLESGFEAGRRSLFILEGLTMYLDERAVDSTFGTIDRLSGAGSELLFDYVRASVLRGENGRYGERGALDGVRRQGEAWTFGLEEAGAALFARAHHFELVEHLDSEALGERYFKSAEGSRAGRVNGTHCIAYARKA